MKWERLRTNRCVKCNKDLGLSATTSTEGGIEYLTCSCGFKISSVRFAEIVSDQVRRRM